MPSEIKERKADILPAKYRRMIGLRTIVRLSVIGRSARYLLLSFEPYRKDLRMIEYHCKGSARISFALTLFLCCISNLGLLALTWIRGVHPVGDLSDAFLWIIFPIILFLGGYAWWAAVCLRDTFTIYRMDEHGITKRSWNGREQHLNWQEVEHTATARRGSMVLIDHRGARISIAPPSYGYRSPQGHDLRHQLDHHLAHRQNAPLQTTPTGHTFPAGLVLTAFCLLFLAVMLIGCAILVTTLPPSASAPPSWTLGFSAACAFAGLLLVVCAIHLSTRAFMLTETGLTYRSLLMRRELPFAEIQAIVVKEIKGKSSTTECTGFVGTTTRIVLAENVPGYEEILRTVRAHLGPRVVENSPHAVAEDIRRDRLQSVLTFSIVGCFFLMLLAIATYNSREEARRCLTQQQALDAQGRQATGQITATYPYRGKTSPPTIYYAFDLGNMRYPGIANVSQKSYEQARVGQTVPVVYLPTDPRISRIPQSRARERAQATFDTDRYMLVFACCLPILMPLIGMTQTAQYRPQSPSAISH